MWLPTGNQLRNLPRFVFRTYREINRMNKSESNQTKIRVAIAGVGNCASSLIQGITYYKQQEKKDGEGLIHSFIGNWAAGDIEIVAAFDVDSRKVGFSIDQAIFAKPNCTRVFQKLIPQSQTIVQMGPIMDGVAAHMADYPDNQAFRISTQTPVDVAAALQQANAEILVCYLPVGSEYAVQHYAEACLSAGVALINCVPVFIASNPEWANKFKAAGLPIIGDDIKSQLGATIVHRTLAHLFSARGMKVKKTYQLNTGGNTDFLNMLERKRLASKKISKSESVQSQLAERLPDYDLHVGPSDYVPWQEDNKVCFIRLEADGFGGTPIELEMRLSVQDSPNSAGVVIDAIRCAKLALERGLAGPLIPVCAAYMKTPPQQMNDMTAQTLTEDFILEGKVELAHKLNEALEKIC